MESTADTQLIMLVAELRADVRHLEAIVKDIKAELRALDERIDRKLERLGPAH